MPKRVCRALSVLVPKWPAGPTAKDAAEQHLAINWSTLLLEDSYSPSIRLSIQAFYHIHPFRDFSHGLRRLFNQSG